MPSHSAPTSPRIVWRVIDWQRVTTVATLTAAALAAAVASAVTLTTLAGQCGWVWGIAWLLPLSVDALAVASWRAWLRGGGRRAAACGAFATLASVAGNTASHLIGAGIIAPSVALVSVVSAMPAIVIALVVHLIGVTPPAEPTATAEPVPVRERHACATPAPQPARPAAPLVVALATPARRPAITATALPKVDARLLAAARKLPREQWSVRRLWKALEEKGCTERAARDLAAVLRAESGATA